MLTLAIFRRLIFPRLRQSLDRTVEAKGPGCDYPPARPFLFCLSRKRAHTYGDKLKALRGGNACF